MRRALQTASAAFLIALAAGLSLAVPRGRPGELGRIALMLAICLACAAFAFAAFRLWLPVAYPILVAGPAALAVWSARRITGARALASRLTPRPVLARLLDDAPAEDALRPCVAIFVDMVGSTRLQIEHGVAAFERRQQQLYGSLADAVGRAGGTVVKFTGDGALSLFFAPSRTGAEGDAMGACASAALSAVRALADALAAINDSHRADAAPPLPVRIGVEAGRAKLTVSETAERVAVDAVGEPINLAARLETLCAELRDGEDVIALFGPVVVAALQGDRDAFLDLGLTPLKGLDAPLRVFRLAEASGRGGRPKAKGLGQR
jgi:class 3 adenylate cyclase